MAGEWYYRLMGEEVGPVSGEELCALQESGRISDDTWVKKGLEGDWVLAGSISSLSAPETVPAQDRQFDPYHRWLGIPPKHQPPNHYRLLAIEPFEDDPEVIRDAADRQMSHVRSYQLGMHSELSQRILNELGAARACLSDPDTKTAYDEQLRRRLQENPVHDGVGGGGVGPRPRRLTQGIGAPRPLTGRSLTAGPQSPKKAILVGSLGVVVVLLVGVMVWAVASRTSRAPGTAQHDDAPTEPDRSWEAPDLRATIVQPQPEQVATLPQPAPAAPVEKGNRRDAPEVQKELEPLPRAKSVPKPKPQASRPPIK